MKNLYLVLLLMVATLPLHAQQEWRVEVASGQAYYVFIEELRGDSIVMSDGREQFRLALRDLVEIRRTVRTGISSGAWAGAGVGVILGVTLSLKAGDEDERIWTIPATALTLGVIGALVGAAAGSADRDEEIYLLAGMALAEKGILLQDLIRRPPAFPQP